MKNKTRNLLFGIGALILSVALMSGCTQSFCSEADTANILFAVDPGVTTYLDKGDEITLDEQNVYHVKSLDEKNAAIEDEAKRNKYVCEKVFDDNDNLFRVIEQNHEGYYYQSKNVLVTIYNEDKTVSYKSAVELKKDSVLNSPVQTAIQKTVSAGGFAPSINYYRLFDQYVLEDVINANNVDTKTLTSEGVTALLDQNASIKYHVIDSKNDLFDSIRDIHNRVVLALPLEEVASENYYSNYKSNLNSQVSSLKSCIRTMDHGEIRYGNYGAYGSSVQIEQKSWGFAWGLGNFGFFEGLLVYPVAWMIDGFTTLFGGVKGNAVPQLLALIVVTVVVRLFIFAATFPSTIQQQKTQALQPELAKIQAKYPNSNTSQTEKQRLAQEQQALYKKYKVHPLLSLLVMVIQFPVFICVWGAMTGSSVLSTGRILGLDLSSSISSVLFNIQGWPGNAGWWTALVLFLLMGGAQFLSMKLPQWIQKARAKKITKLGKNPAQNQQNKTMNIVSYVMLAVIIFMGFTLPAAMGVYWFVGALVSLVQSFITQAIAGALVKKNKKNR